MHPGGPFWKGKENGTWSIPKGELTDDEDPLVAAKREFLEETNQNIDGDFIALEPVKQKSGKWVYAWAVEGNVDENNIVSNLISIEWPPKSKKMISIPEVDKGGWFTIEEALVRINPAQSAFLHQLKEITGTI